MCTLFKALILFIIVNHMFTYLFWGPNFSRSANNTSLMIQSVCYSSIPSILYGTPPRMAEQSERLKLDRRPQLSSPNTTSQSQATAACQRSQVHKVKQPRGFRSKGLTSAAASLIKMKSCCQEPYSWAPPLESEWCDEGSIHDASHLQGR